MNAMFRCASCEIEFKWPAEEQQFWFEELKFWIDSRPKNCIECRKDARVHKETRKIYDAKIDTALRSKNIEKKKEMIRIIDLLCELESEVPRRMAEKRMQLYSAVEKLEGRST